MVYWDQNRRVTARVLHAGMESEQKGHSSGTTCSDGIRTEGSQLGYYMQGWDQNRRVTARVLHAGMESEQKGHGSGTTCRDGIRTEGMSTLFRVGGCATTSRRQRLVCQCQRHPYKPKIGEKLCQSLNGQNSPTACPIYLL